MARMCVLLVCVLYLAACQDVVGIKSEDCSFPLSFKDDANRTLWQAAVGRGGIWACLRVEWKDQTIGTKLVRLTDSGEVLGKANDNDQAYTAKKVSLPQDTGRAGQWKEMQILALGTQLQGADEAARQAACNQMSDPGNVCAHDASQECWMRWVFGPGTSASGTSCAFFRPTSSQGEVSKEPGEVSEPHEHSEPSEPSEPMTTDRLEPATDAEPAGETKSEPVADEPASEPKSEGPTDSNEMTPDPTLEPVRESREPVRDEPMTPDEPTRPDEPKTPDEPMTPDEPVTPDEPATPGEPVTPDEPNVPDEPVTPDEPVVEQPDAGPETTPVCTDGATRPCLPLGGLLLPGHVGRGPCKMGTQTCSGGQWVSCLVPGNVMPQTEQCNGKDDDCNGYVDDGLDCSTKPQPHVHRCPGALPCVTTVVGAADLSVGSVLRSWVYRASQIVLGPSGKAYIADTGHHRILVFDTSSTARANETVYVLAGTGRPGYRDGPAYQARFKSPRGLTLKGGSLYVADSENYVVRKIDLTTLEVSLVAGKPGTRRTTTTSTPVAQATFYFPYAIAFNAAGELLIADWGGANPARIQRLSAGTLSTFFTLSTGDQPGGIVAAGAPEFVYVSIKNRNVIEQIDATGSSKRSLSGGGTGLKTPEGLSVFGGKIYIADSGNGMIRTFDPSNNSFSTVLQSRRHGIGGTIPLDGDLVTGIAVSSNHYFVVGALGSATGALSGRVFEFESNGVLRRTIGEEPAGSVLGVPDKTRLNQPYAVHWGAKDSRLYWTELGGDRVVYTTFFSGSSSTSLAAPTGLYQPRGLVTNRAGDLFVAGTRPHALYRYNASNSHATWTVFTGTPGMAGDRTGAFGNALYSWPSGMTLIPGTTVSKDHLYLTDAFNHQIKRISFDSSQVEPFVGSSSSGFRNGTKTTAALNRPWALTADAAGGMLYIADTFNSSIRRVIIASQTVQTLASRGSGNPVPDIVISSLNLPEGVAYDSKNHILYIADTGNHCIRKIDLKPPLSNTSASIVAGICATSGAAGFSDGPVTESLFFSPKGLAVDADGNLYVADYGNHRIRKIIFQ